MIKRFLALAALATVSLSVVAFAPAISHAQSANNGMTNVQFSHGGTMGMGFGFMTTTLVGAARLQAPIPGVDPDIARSRGEPVNRPTIETTDDEPVEIAVAHADPVAVH